MTRKFNRLLVSLVASGALAISTLSFAGTNGDARGDKGMKAIIASLDLTDEQRQQLRQTQFLTKAKSKRSGLASLMPIAFKDEVDELQLSLMLDAVVAKQKASGFARAQRMHQVRQILTDDQAEQIRAAMEEKKAARMDNKPSRKGLERLLSKLDLTDAQQDTIQPAIEALQQNKEEMRNTLANFRQSARSIVEADEFDEQAWLDLFDLHAPNIRQQGEASVATLNSIYVALDEQQQMKLKKMLKRLKKHKRSKKREG